jgi:16S rRNA (adenine1518-N6/adenine1519-N6)-dimethyltransferase
MNLDQHRTKKALGQHFLRDAGIVQRIITALDPQPGERIVEIGPGAGALTFPLFARHGALTAIEFDRDLIEPLTAAASGIGSLSVISADVLTVDFRALAAGTPLRVVGNLPYNISSPILFHLLAQADAVCDMHFMLQKEVVDRMAAAPGSKVYGRLSVMLQAGCHVTPLFFVPPSAFQPPPKVDSAVVRLVPRPAEEIGIVDTALFSAVVRKAFGQRRKTLRNALDGLVDVAMLHDCGIDPGARAETLAVPQFIALSNKLAGHDVTFTMTP